MRLAVDATVLAYAVNRHTPEHPRAAQILEDLVNGELVWALPWPAVQAFVELVSHPHAVVRPLKPSEALGFVREVLASPVVRPLAPTPRHAEVLAEIAAQLAEPESHGLETAAVLREHGVRELLSTDRAMRRYPFLEVVDPLHGPPWNSVRRPQRRYRLLRRRSG